MYIVYIYIYIYIHTSAIIALRGVTAAAFIIHSFTYPSHEVNAPRMASESNREATDLLRLRVSDVINSPTPRAGLSRQNSYNPPLPPLTTPLLVSTADLRFNENRPNSGVFSRYTKA